jgi:hypothetical protein
LVSLTLSAFDNCPLWVPCAIRALSFLGAFWIACAFVWIATRVKRRVKDTMNFVFMLRVFVVVKGIGNRLLCLELV